MRVLVNDVAILEGARLRFIGVADQINRFLLIRLDEAPFHPARETGSAASTQTGVFDFVHNLSARHLVRSLKLLVAAMSKVAVDVDGVTFAADVLENQAPLEWVRWRRVERER